MRVKAFEKSQTALFKRKGIKFAGGAIITNTMQIYG